MRTSIPTSTGRGERPRELRAHCLPFCSALSRHHTGEDEGAFPVLAERFPELRPVLAELERDHQVVAGILRRLEELLGGLGAEADPDREPTCAGGCCHPRGLRPDLGACGGVWADVGRLGCHSCYRAPSLPPQWPAVANEAGECVHEQRALLAWQVCAASS